MPSRRPTALLLIALTPLLALAVLALSRPTPADAHPLGNFTVNRYSRLEVYSDAVRIRYILDMAEIPAYQELPEIDTNGDDDLTSSENQAYVGRKAQEIAGNLRLTVNGSEVHPIVLSSEISYPEGQAGLPTLRASLLLHAPVTGANVDVGYSDDNYADRIGWKEVVVRPAEGVALSTSSVATDDISAELTSYPSDLLSSPLDVTSASFSVAPGQGTKAPEIDSDANGMSAPDEAPSRAGGGFASLIDTDDMTLPVIVLSLLLALGFGAIHALEPGHGKTFVAAYFVGVKGTVRQALALGLIVATTHTIGVLAIGLVTLFGSQFILPEKLYPYLSLASGLMILALGVRLIAARAGGWRAARRFLAAVRRYAYDPQADIHDYDHDHHHHHSHEATAGAPPWKTLLALGLADGLTPSPSALIVLLAAVSLDRIGLGVLLIIAFSVGLALVLTFVSLALLYARSFLQWLGARGVVRGRGTRAVLIPGTGSAALLKLAPMGGAVSLVVVGVVLTVRALAAPGLPVF
jgi:nickel/cobalt transporter (NicO) family protein